MYDFKADLFQIIGLLGSPLSMVHVSSETLLINILVIL